MYDEADETPSERLMSGQDVAVFLGMTEGSVRNWRQEKKGPPYFRFGNGIIRYRRSEVEAWLDAQRVTVSE
jgi:predicted DNA-binding transcriptional regulator AlpA